MRKQFQISENGFEISKITLDLQIDNWNFFLNQFEIQKFWRVVSIATNFSFHTNSICKKWTSYLNLNKNIV